MAVLGVPPRRPTSGGFRLRMAGGLLLVFLAVAGRALPATPRSARLNDLEAVFLFNFAAFVEWPGDALHPDHSPLVIGVLGHDPFDGALEKIVHGEAIGGHPLVVRFFRRASDVDACHILFVSGDQWPQPSQVLAGLRGRSILTVGDGNDFNAMGGIIRFVDEGDHLHLCINLDAARAARLRISAKLLRPSEIYQHGGS